jgi:hypothetical protein
MQQPLFRILVLFAAIAIVILLAPRYASAAKLTVEIANADGVTLVGAIHRWDADGNARRQPDPKAKIDAPEVDAKATAESGGHWIFNDLPQGTYDLVILAKDRRRIEGFQFAPVKEFDPFMKPSAQPEAEARDWILDDIKKSEHYENRVEPLYLAGDAKTVRVLVMLLRDKPTSYEGDMPGAATLRHEIWQYTWNYGGWEKEKRTKVMDRAILPRNELRKWTWLWDPKLGGIEVKYEPVTVKTAIPKPSAEKKLKGLYPYW